jgi:hypothetical protein
VSHRASLCSHLLFKLFQIPEEASTEMIGLDAKLCSDFDQESGIGICC